MGIFNLFRNKKENSFAKVVQTEEYKQKEKNYREWIQQNGIPLPSKDQLEWLDDEIGMFCHFGINTFHNKEWSNGTLPASSFRPTNLDCNQWVKVAKELGANYMIATAKHHDGFCLWQTETTDYSVKSSPWKNGKGDVIKEFMDACKKADMKAGVYLSPWDRHEPCYKDKEAYDKFYIKQLTELLTWYDIELKEIWFDGAGSAGRKYDWDSIIATCKKYQPNAMIFGMGEPTIRWVGNEQGYAYDPNWNVIYMENFDSMQKEENNKVGIKLVSEYGFGNVWCPAECDMPIRNHTWFYNTNNENKIYSLKHLVDMYEKSVGRGSNLLLNLAPNREGLIDPADAKRAKELGNQIRKRYSKPLAEKNNENLSKVSEILELDLDSEIQFNSIIAEEDIAQGERIREFKVEYWKNNKWNKFGHGWSMGHKKLVHGLTVSSNKIRVTALNYLLEPMIKKVSVYKIEHFSEPWYKKWYKIPTIPRIM